MTWTLTRDMLTGGVDVLPGDWTAWVRADCPGTVAALVEASDAAEALRRAPWAAAGEGGRP